MVRRRLEFDKKSAVAIIPNLLTMGNAICGFGAIVFIAGAAANWDGTGDLRLAFSDGKLSMAGWLILLGMIFDALDGKVARITKQVSDIGAQLDSLCDAVTFGVAPAFMVWKTVSLLPSEVIHIPPKVAWVLAVLYLACVLLRLARFNAETDLTEGAHLSFEGLPSPAAAGVIAALSILNIEIFNDSNARYPGLVFAFFLVIPIVALILGLLMVSKIPYPHILNTISKGKKPFGYMVLVIFVLAALFILPYYSLPLAGVFMLYSFGPLARSIIQKPLKKAPNPTVEERSVK
jgi:CDP-diacylglycerol--serine O-phosphatidyltransferase